MSTHQTSQPSAILGSGGTIADLEKSITPSWLLKVNRWLTLSDQSVLQATLSLLLAFGLARTLLFKATKMPEAAYFSPSLIAEMAQRVPGLLVLSGVGLCLWFGWSKLRWAELDSGNALRMLIGIVAGTLAWTFSVYDFNLYYGQFHLVERLLLITLFLGGLWRPILIVPFLALVYTITHQFNQPLSCTWTDKRVLFDVLSLFVGFMLTRLWLPKGWPTVKSGDFFFLVICLQAANYFIPGWGKLISGWPLIERLDNLFVASYLNGWWGHLTQEQALGWAAVIARWNPAMVWGSLILELAALACLWNRRCCIALFLACVGLHAMICLTTGILFWKWIILDFAICLVLVSRNAEITASLFSRQRFYLSVGLIVASPLIFDPPWLAWYDTELNEQYHMEVVTQGGKTYQLPRTFLVPYEVYFAQNKFHFLITDQFVNGRYGTTPSWDVALRLDGRPTPEVAEAVRQELGHQEFSESKGAAFERFVKRYFSNLNSRGTQHALVPNWLQPPQHIYSVVPQPRYDLQDQVTLVRVIHERSLYQRDRIETLKREVVREIEVP